MSWNVARGFSRAAVAATVVMSVAALRFAPPLRADDSEKLLTIDHFVRVRSTVPAIAGQDVPIYARERVLAGAALRGATADRVALFVHGAGTPAEVSFDVPAQDYSWMAYLARAGFDVFAMDTTGYGRSVRPSAMTDPCNLAKDRQGQFVPSLIPAPCPPSYPHAMTTLESDWNDIGAVVDYVRVLRHVDKVNLLAWSLGGPRAGGYAAQHPDKVRSLVLLAPAYFRGPAAGARPAAAPATGAPAANAQAAAVAFNTQSRAEFDANWDRQVGCPAQYEPAVSDSVWSEMLASDPVGATWGSGVRRAPQTASAGGWNSAMVAKTQIPTLMVSGQHDKQVQPDRVRELYADLGAPQKVFVDLACSSHNAMWEKHHLLLFKASLEWLTQGTVNGAKEGTLRLGY